jgi:acetoin utilization protein AcuC
MMNPSSIASINNLPPQQKRDIYKRVISPQVMGMFDLNPYYVDNKGNNLLEILAPEGSTDVEMKLFHEYGFPDPILYGHLTDTINGQIHVLLYIMNDPFSPRFDIDRMPDGTPTQFGTANRNKDAELKAMEAGLLPGQVRKGLGLLAPAASSFEHFVLSLNHDIYFVEPLYYHNALIFERYGFTYQFGRKYMQKIHTDFQPGGELYEKLDGSPFRKPAAAVSIRGRSWAIHDGILGESYADVTMYKRVGKSARVNTTPDLEW